MLKAVPTSVGFRVKSGWAVAVLIEGPPATPKLVDVRRVQLSDPSVPKSAQPHHVALRTPGAEGRTSTAMLVKSVHDYGQASVIALLEEYAAAGRRPACAAIVVGSQIDPATIKNDHIRAHAEEGQLFRTVVASAVASTGMSQRISVEKRLYVEATTALGQSEAAIRRVLVGLGRGVEGGWRSDEKSAALAAWMALA